MLPSSLFSTYILLVARRDGIQLETDVTSDGKFKLQTIGSHATGIMASGISLVSP